MKIFFLPIFTFVTAIVGFAQAPIISTVNFLDPGTRLIAHLDTISVTPGANGASQSWNYSYLRNILSDTIEFISPVGTLNFSKYPTSTAAIFTPYDSSYGYLTSNANGFWQNNMTLTYTIYKPNNMTGKYKFDFAYSPAQQVLQLPFTYLTTWSGSSSGKQALAGAPLFDSVRYSRTETYVSLGDAWGMIKTPVGSYGNSVRVKTTSSTQTLFETLTAGKWSTFDSKTSYDTTYTWYAPNADQPLLDLHMKGKGKYFAYYYGDILTALVDDRFAGSSLVAYPNPAKEEFFVKGAQELLQISHTSGQAVPFNSTHTPEGVLVRLEGATPGMYLATLKQGNATKTIKVAVTE